MLLKGEARISAGLEAALSQWFSLIPQVRMLHLGGDHLRIDFVAIPTSEGFPSPLVGIECKACYKTFSEYADALKQAIDYRHATLADSRIPSPLPNKLPFVFLFPGSTYRPDWCAGADRLAGKFNVGVIHQEQGQVIFRVNAERLWSSEYGARADAARFSTHRIPGNR